MNSPQRSTFRHFPAIFVLDRSQVSLRLLTWPTYAFQPNNGNYKPAIKFDGANGVGALMMRRFIQHLGSTLGVEMYNEQGQLNHQVRLFSSGGRPALSFAYLCCWSVYVHLLSRSMIFSCCHTVYDIQMPRYKWRPSLSGLPLCYCIQHVFRDCNRASPLLTFCSISAFYSHPTRVP